MSEIDFSNLVTLAQFAEKAGIKTVTTVLKWATDADVKPVHKFGNTNVYLLSDLQSAMEKHSANAKGFKALGYVHPDQHREVMDHRDRLAVALAELQTNMNGLQAAYDITLRKLTALEDAGVDNWSGYDIAMSMFHGEPDEDGEAVADITDEDILAKAAEFGVTILTDV